MSELMDRAVIGMPFDMAMQNHLSRMQFYNRAQAILAERDALLDRAERAEAAAQKSACEAVSALGQAHDAYEAQRKAEAERDALQGQLNDLRNGWANSVKAHAALLAERDAAFAAGQRDMQERAADATLYLCRMKGMGNRTIDGPEAAHLIRALPIKDGPDGR